MSKLEFSPRKTCELCGKPKPVNIYRVCDRCLEDKHEERRQALLLRSERGEQ